MRFDDASQALVELAASRHNAFHSSEAARIPSHRLRRAEQRGELIRLRPRVWSIASLGRPVGQATRAAVLDTGGSAAAHLSACWAHAWTEIPPDPVHVWMPYRGRRTPPGVAPTWCRTIDPQRDITEANGIRCLNKAATLSLLGRVAPPDLVSHLLDAFLRTESIHWLEQTLDRLHQPNDRGTTTLARLLDDPARRGGTESIMERRLVDLLTRPDLPPPHPQFTVRYGAQRFRLDVAYPELLLGIEAHSRRFHWGRHKEAADNRRDLQLGALGWKVLYITWDQLERPTELLTLIEQTIRARSHQLLSS